MFFSKLTEKLTNTSRDQKWFIFAPKAHLKMLLKQKCHRLAGTGRAQHITTGGLNIRTSGGAIQKSLYNHEKLSAGNLL